MMEQPTIPNNEIAPPPVPEKQNNVEGQAPQENGPGEINAHLNNLSELERKTSAKIEERTDALLQEAIERGDTVAVGKLTALKEKMMKAGRTALAAAAFLTASPALAQDAAPTEKITSPPTAEAQADTRSPYNLSGIDTTNLGIVVEGVLNGAGTAVGDVARGVQKAATAETPKEKIEGVKDALGAIPGTGKAVGMIENAENVANSEANPDSRVASGGKILEAVGGKLSPLGTIIANAMEIKQDIADGKKSGPEIAFKVARLVASAAVGGGIPGILANTLFDMAGKAIPFNKNSPDAVKAGEETTKAEPPSSLDEKYSVN